PVLLTIRRFSTFRRQVILRMHAHGFSYSGRFSDHISPAVVRAGGDRVALGFRGWGSATNRVFVLRIPANTPGFGRRLDLSSHPASPADFPGNRAYSGRQQSAIR